MAGSNGGGGRCGPVDFFFFCCFFSGGFVGGGGSLGGYREKNKPTIKNNVLQRPHLRGVADNNTRGSHK